MILPKSKIHYSPAKSGNLKSKTVLLLFTLLLRSLTAWQPPASPLWQWERAETGLRREAIMLAVAAHPFQPEILWAGYYAPGGVITSRDGGRTWSAPVDGL